MNILGYKKILNEFKRSLKESETKKQISLFSYEKKYNDKLEELYQNINSLIKSKQLKENDLENYFNNEDLRINLYKNCIELEIKEYIDKIDNQYILKTKEIKKLNEEYFNYYETLVNNFSITYENTIDRLNKEISRIDSSVDKESVRELDILNKEIENKSQALKNLYIRLNDEKLSNKNSFINQNMNINKQITNSRKDFIELLNADNEKYQTLLKECDKRKNHLENRTKLPKAALDEYQTKKDLIEKKYQNNTDDYKSKINDLLKQNEIKEADIKLDQIKSNNEISDDYKIKLQIVKNEALKLEANYTKDKRKIEEARLKVGYEFDLQKIEIERDYIDAIIDNNINLQISLLTNEIDILKRKRQHIIDKDLYFKKFNIHKINERIKEISISNMLKSEHEKLLRDRNVDIEYLKLNAYKANLEFDKKKFENNKYIELLDFCHLLALKNYKIQEEFINEIYNIDTLKFLYENNIDDTKTKYAIYQSNLAIEQKISNIIAEKTFILDMFEYTKKEFVFDKYTLEFFKRFFKLFSFSKINESSNIDNQKNEHQKKYKKEIIEINELLQDKEVLLENLVNELEKAKKENSETFNYITILETEINAINLNLKNKIGDLTELRDQLIESINNLNTFKNNYSQTIATIKKLEKEISTVKKSINSLERKKELSNQKINSRFLTTELLLTKKPLYVKYFEKITYILNKINLDTETNEANKYFKAINKVINSLYNKLLQYEYDLLENNKHKLLSTQNINKIKHNNKLLPIIKNKKIQLNEIKLNKKRHNKEYYIQYKEYLTELDKAKYDNETKRHIIYESISLRRNKFRLDSLAFKNNTFSLRKNFEHDLNIKYIETFDSIRKSEREVNSFIKKTILFKNEATARNKSRFKSITFEKNDNLKELSYVKKMKLRNINNDLLLIEKQFLDKNKEISTIEKDALIVYKTKTKEVENHFEKLLNKNNKEYNKMKRKELKKL